MVHFMDTLKVLREVSDAYRRLKTLSVSAIHLIISLVTKLWYEQPYAYAFFIRIAG